MMRKSNFNYSHMAGSTAVQTMETFSSIIEAPLFGKKNEMTEIHDSHVNRKQKLELKIDVAQ